MKPIQNTIILILVNTIIKLEDNLDKDLNTGNIIQEVAQQLDARYNTHLYSDQITPLYAYLCLTYIWSPVFVDTPMLYDLPRRKIQALRVNYLRDVLDAVVDNRGAIPTYIVQFRFDKDREYV